MYEIREVKYRRPVEIDGQLCAEIGILPESKQETPLLVYVTPVRSGGYHIVKVLRNDANYSTDWYDNNMHNAFEEVANESFVQDDPCAGWNTRAHFLDNILGDEQVRKQLDWLFDLEGR
ncbi:carboxypeptidase [Paenibacillus sp. 481]|uniref:carboxypeptidase n=1 Tax=Paenibacillus sp. 481 TaxID=2835869 RepID=UPI001E441981|nr:carboxypeptidase [Paenibacillus sp. 481]UHA74392.1 carboxypeptidase [Paenibacillus sp. 481]